MPASASIDPLVRPPARPRTDAFCCLRARQAAKRVTSPAEWTRVPRGRLAISPRWPLHDVGRGHLCHHANLDALVGPPFRPRTDAFCCFGGRQAAKRVTSPAEWTRVPRGRLAISPRWPLHDVGRGHLCHHANLDALVGQPARPRTHAFCCFRARQAAKRVTSPAELRCRPQTCRRPRSSLRGRRRTFSASQSITRGSSPRRGLPPGGRPAPGTASTTRSRARRCGRSAPTRGRHRARHKRPP